MKQMAEEDKEKEETKYLEALRQLSEARDLLVEITKVVQTFADEKSWHKNYDDPTKGCIDTFNHFDLDPIILAMRGERGLFELEKRVNQAWEIVRWHWDGRRMISGE